MAGMQSELQNQPVIFSILLPAQNDGMYPVATLPPLPPQPVALKQFEPISLSSLSAAVRHLKPSNCPSDCLPSRLFKDATVFDSVAPFLLLLVNSILSSGCVPGAFKHAVVQPLLKKPNLDPSTLSNFRPISKLPFLSKVLEREVYVQLQSFLTNNNIFEKFQSGFRTAHSTETALLRVLNDLLLAADSGSPVILVLLDLTAAFDTVDHGILLSQLEHRVGIKDTALNFFQSYLADRTFSVQLGDCISSVAPLTCGVPQGSILGPILFLLYILPLGEILARHNISYHCFADDVLLYLPLKANGQAALHSLLDCLADIKAWMGANFLNLNENKTEIIVFGKTSPAFSTDALGPLASNIRPSVRNLGVIFDSAFKFEQQVSAVVRKSFFHLRTLAKTKAYLPRSALERVIHAFITSQLDYCNALYTGIDQSQLRRLQLVQNSAARLLTCTKKREHITPVLASLHWLPIRYRIDFKLLLTVFKSLHGLAPTYLSDLLHHHIPSRALRSADQLLLEVPRTRLKTKGDRAFAVAAPSLWNCLPFHIRAAQSYYELLLLAAAHGDRGTYTCRAQEFRLHKDRWRAHTNSSASTELRETETEEEDHEYTDLLKRARLRQETWRRDELARLKIELESQSRVQQPVQATQDPPNDKASRGDSVEIDVEKERALEQERKQEERVTRLMEIRRQNLQWRFQAEKLRKELAAVTVLEIRTGIVLISQGVNGTSNYVIWKGLRNIISNRKGVMTTLHEGQDLLVPFRPQVIRQEHVRNFLRVGNRDFMSILKDVNANMVHVEEKGVPALILKRSSDLMFAPGAQEPASCSNKFLVKSGTPDKILQFLLFSMTLNTPDDQMDPFVCSFLLTYHVFMTSEELGHTSLTFRFTLNSEQSVDTGLVQVKERVVTLVLQWVALYGLLLLDNPAVVLFFEKLSRQVKGYAHLRTLRDYPEIRAMRPILMNNGQWMKNQPSNRDVMAAVKAPAGDSLLVRVQSSGAREQLKLDARAVSFLSIDEKLFLCSASQAAELVQLGRKANTNAVENMSAKALAVQLTSYDWELFNAMHETELLYYVLGSKLFPNSLTANLESFIRRFNVVVYWVATELCLCAELSKRAQLMRKFIQMASM
ncbi:uncharacterized protein LOC134079180 [Sardina pilchardus]|uniref:uncharacterized protein LOC134079180 n=1 Tax=Sardina pilchardus TaxID=27697 RepID=UPI002E13A01B